MYAQLYLNTQYGPIQFSSLIAILSDYRIHTDAHTTETSSFTGPYFHHGPPPPHGGGGRGVHTPLYIYSSAKEGSSRSTTWVSIYSTYSMYISKAIPLNAVHLNVIRLNAI
jgi:hypothetical protein